jgi:hypothetical protein
LGYQALYSNTTATNNTAVGYQAGYSHVSPGYSVYIGNNAGYLSTGQLNTFVGPASGNAFTTGIKNTVIGGFTGNQGGLDIRTSSNNIVLSDGDGNPRLTIDANGYAYFAGSGFTSTYTPTAGVQILNLSGNTLGVITIGHATGSGSGSYYETFSYAGGIIGSITQTGTTGVLYNTTSDYRLKNDVTPIQNALATVEALNPVSFTWTDNRKDDGFLAHELQAIIPNCVTGEKDAVNEDGTPKYQQIDNSGVIPFLVKAIQELKAEFDAYKATHP